MMQPITIQLRERTSLNRPGEPLRFGVPLAKGALFSTASLQLLSSGGKPERAQFRPLTHWPDGSIRWVCIDALSGAEAKALSLATQAPSEAQAASASTVEVMTETQKLKVRYDHFELSVERDSPQWHWTGPDNESFTSRLRLDDRHDAPCTAHLDSNWQVTDDGPVATTLAAHGWWHDSQGQKLARFRCELTFYADGLVTVDAMIHNPRRARHPGGLWDLGDPGSIHFGGMAVETLTPQNEQFRLALSTDDTNPGSYTAEHPLYLHQESSGGDNWNSRNHINAQGQVIPRYRGYRLQHGTVEPRPGLRASPVLEATAGTATIAISQPHFWQNFPSALEARESSIRAWLFPIDKREPYELQGGERKNQRVILGYGQRLEQLTWTHSPLVPVIPAEHYEATDAFPWFRANQPKTLLDELIQEGLDGPSNFFAKREVIDEYGWRNFGDIFADHETLYQKEGEAPFISHYNNQYDAIYGFARQFALTGDPRWFELMDDLARHVVDIDIYHTEEDRAEYNNGLFWHTDHYLDAHTATHRTFSRHNETSSTPGQTGGGPGAEHCYTTGHLYHYWMTGTLASKEALFKLTHWTTTLHEGEKGFFAQLLALKKNELPKLRNIIRGKPVTGERFPFTRGTGNYINALLDAYSIGASNEWMEQACRAIKSCIHPSDEIDSRGLLDVETGWSYLILLSGIARFLLEKARADQIDDDWHYARLSFLHYTLWMRDNEAPFLLSPKKLEFANHTWTAQDIRKAALMYQAAELAGGSESCYLNKAETWMTYVLNTLKNNHERRLSRIIIILSQNYGMYCSTSAQGHPPTPATPELKLKPPTLGLPRLALQIALRLASGLVHLRPRKEALWLKKRLN